MHNDAIQNESLSEETHQQTTDKKRIKISVKTAVMIVVVIVLGSLAYIYKGVFVAAMVNGSPISRLSIIKELEKTSGKSVLTSLINERLLQNAVNDKKITVSDSEISNELKKLEDQITSQGSTLASALAAQNLSMDDLKKRVTLQKEVEMLLADKIGVTDEEVTQYIKSNKISVPKERETTVTEQIKNDLKSQKLNAAAQTLLAELNTKAKIRYFVNY